MSGVSGRVVEGRRVRAGGVRGRAACGTRRLLGGLLAAVTLLSALAVALGPAAASAAAAPPLPPMTAGRHVYDYGHLMSPRGVARAEELAGSIESLGGGRVAIYTADLMALPNDETIVEQWHIDGLLLTGYDVMGDATIGDTLRARLDEETVKAIGSGPGPQTTESWMTSALARAEAHLRGTHVFDGVGLDPATRDRLEAHAAEVSGKTKARVIVDVAVSKEGKDAPQTAAFFNGADLESTYGGSIVIAVGVSPGGSIGGYLDTDSDFWESYETKSPWSSTTMATHATTDVNAAVLEAVEAVHAAPSPVDVVADAASGAASAIGGFFSDRTNQLASLAAIVAAILSIVLLSADRRRRRREGGWEDDDSVLAAGPPDGMTPALASLVTAPLDATRAVTTALLDLASHGAIAFYEEMTPFGPRGGIRVLAGAAASAPVSDQSGIAAASRPSVRTSRPLGTAERGLLDALEEQAAMSGTSYLSPGAFAGIRPIFERTAEQLTATAKERGWLTVQTRSVSRAWSAVGVGELVAAVVAVLVGQPVAAACLLVASYVVTRRAVSMPLPLRTRDGVITNAMLEAYRRTLRHVLASPAGALPAWLDSAEDATLWGYAWGLEGDVQAFVDRTVRGAMGEGAAAGDQSIGRSQLDTELAQLLQLALANGGGTGPTRPIGLDTDAIAAALNGIGRPLAAAPSPAAAPGPIATVPADAAQPPS